MKHLDPAIFPARIAKLPRDPRGYPIPRFVERHPDGSPNFTLTSSDHWARCAKFRLCWICGDQCGKHLAYVCGPSFAVAGVTSEPGCHLECAEFAMRTCPFIMFPNRPRDAIPEGFKPAEFVKPSDHNPGVWLLLIATHYAVVPRGDSCVIRPGTHSRFEWRKQGRPATPEEIVTALGVSAGKLVAQNPGMTIASLVERARPYLPQQETV